jgi:hypothetical protein
MTTTLRSPAAWRATGRSVACTRVRALRRWGGGREPHAALASKDGVDRRARAR